MRRRARCTGLRYVVPWERCARTGRLLACGIRRRGLCSRRQSDTRRTWPQMLAQKLPTERGAGVRWQFALEPRAQKRTHH